ncbi:MAG: hypothetical protein Kow0063_31290 [Anaerolineae bacterium]
MREPSSPRPSTTEQILDLLLDALLERQAARQKSGLDPSRPAPEPAPPPAPRTKPGIKPLPSQTTPEQPDSETPPTAPKPPSQPTEPRRRKPRPGEKGWVPPPRLPGINLARTLGRLALALFVLVVLVNIPLNRYGTSLARIMPDSAALVIRDGLVLKGSGPEIYVLEDNKLRWISSLEAFEFFDYRWEQVHIVDDSFLDDFEKGKPIHVLLKCHGSPHIYALENGQKRWIKDIPTFEAEGYVWEDVKQVSCTYLRELPDGPPIPQDAGPPPEP